MKDWRESEWFKAWLKLAQHGDDEFPRERESISWLRLTLGEESSARDSVGSRPHFC
jgi:hypothetical protein